MMNKSQNMFNNLYTNVESVREETFSTLGIDMSFHIIAMEGNAWIDINHWLFTEYPKEVLSNIVIIEYQKLFKEIYWLQYIFLCSNYPMVYRNLRYIWELLYKAHYVLESSGSNHLEDQLNELQSMEKSKYGWKIIEKVLKSTLLLDDHQIKSEIQPLWNFLNIHVHPSVRQLDLVIDIDPSSLVTDSFNEELARLSIDTVDKVFDLLYASIFKKFEKIKKHACHSRKTSFWIDDLPYTYDCL